MYLRYAWHFKSKRERERERERERGALGINARWIASFSGVMDVAPRISMHA